MFFYLDDSQRPYWHATHGAWKMVGMNIKNNCNCDQGEDGDLKSVTSPLFHSNSIFWGHSVGRRGVEGDNHRPDVMLSSLWAGQELRGRVGQCQHEDLKTVVPGRWTPWWCYDSQTGRRLVSALRVHFLLDPRELGRNQTEPGKHEETRKQTIRDHCLSTFSGLPTCKLLLRSPGPARERMDWTIRLSPLWNSCWERPITTCTGRKKLIRMPRCECSIRETFWR